MLRRNGLCDLLRAFAASEQDELERAAAGCNCCHSGDRAARQRDVFGKELHSSAPSTTLKCHLLCHDAVPTAALSRAAAHAALGRAVEPQQLLLAKAGRVGVEDDGAPAA